jgi:hypothetical protein
VQCREVEVKCSDVRWSAVMWGEVQWSGGEVQWCEVKYEIEMVLS